MHTSGNIRREEGKGKLFLVLIIYYPIFIREIYYEWWIINYNRNQEITSIIFSSSLFGVALHISFYLLCGDSPNKERREYWQRPVFLLYSLSHYVGQKGKGQRKLSGPTCVREEKEEMRTWTLISSSHILSLCVGLVLVHSWPTLTRKNEKKILTRRQRSTTFHSFRCAACLTVALTIPSTSYLLAWNCWGVTVRKFLL